MIEPKIYVITNYLHV